MLKALLKKVTKSDDHDDHSKIGKTVTEEFEGKILKGLYKPPLPLPPKPNERMKKVASPTDSAIPRHKCTTPPREEFLDQNRFSSHEDIFVYNSFEDITEFADSYSYCVALFDYAKSNPNDMELQAGEVLELINTGSTDWWKGCTANKKGYFPTSYVQLVSRGDTVMKALYDFTPSGQGEMSLQEGQIVIMTQNDGDGWLFGKSGDAVGLFPANYVKKIASV